MNEDKLITLADEEGNEIDFEVLDIIKLDGADYAFLLPVAEGADDESTFEVVVTRLTVDGEEAEFEAVTEPDEINSAFEAFKEKNKDSFKFTE